MHEKEWGCPHSAASPFLSSYLHKCFPYPIHSLCVNQCADMLDLLFECWALLHLLFDLLA
jgi:hypothetical protein